MESITGNGRGTPRYTGQMPTTLAARIIVIAFPVFFMIALIPYVVNDLILTAIYIAIIAVSAIEKKPEETSSSASRMPSVLSGMSST